MKLGIGKSITKKLAAACMIGWSEVKPSEQLYTVYSTRYSSANALVLTEVCDDILS